MTEASRPPIPRLRSGANRARQAVVQAWQTSLQLRVGLTTVLVTGAVIFAVGVFLLNQISSGVLRAKRTAAIAQSNLGLSSAADTLGGPELGDVAGIADAIEQAKQRLSATGGAAGLFLVAIESPSDTVNDQQTSDPAVALVSDAMRRLVQSRKLVIQYDRGELQAGPTRVLIVGQPVAARAGIFELYYVFPLTAEEKTLALVQRTVLLAGLGLVLLVLLIALLVTRQVVRPVRVAATTAARLADGDLAQRIKVQGSDDIARLGRSFNGMAESLQRQIRRLEELSRLQRRFTSDVSHELRTPLTTIRMATELLHAQRQDFPPELARSVELLQAELDRFEALLAELLEISRYDAGVARLDTETVDLRSVVINAVDASRVLAARHGSELLLSLPAVPVSAEVDPRRVQRILRNLLGNALDHGEGRPVRITLAGDGEAVAVTVRDHGVGLRPGEAGLVFNRFWRGDPSRSRLTGGTGLGLAISLEDALLHGGWLQAWGERGRGAQFRLTLPCRSGQPLLAKSPLPLEPDDLDAVVTGDGRAG